MLTDDAVGYDDSQSSGSKILWRAALAATMAPNVTSASANAMAAACRAARSREFPPAPAFVDAA